MSSRDDDQHITARTPVFVALSRDLFFGMRARTVIRKLGHDLTLVDSEERLLDAVSIRRPSLAIIDFNQPVAWDVLASLMESDVPVLAFGAHTDVEGFRAARAAGADRVTSNGDFSRRLPELIERYSTP